MHIVYLCNYYKMHSEKYPQRWRWHRAVNNV